MELDFVVHFDAVTIVGYAILGALVGFLSGLFGVGGGFLLTPLLNVVFGLPYNLAVGSSLVQMSPMSWVSTSQHLRMGHVDVKLGVSLLIGALFGAETGVRLQGTLREMDVITLFGKEAAGFEFSMALLFVVLLASIGYAMLLETQRTAKRLREEASPSHDSRREESATGEELATGEEAKSGAASDEGRPGQSGEPKPSRFGRWLSDIQAPPRVILSTDERELSLWVPAGIGFSVSILTGLLGAGGGIIYMPVLIYVLGVRTHVAVGTSSLITSCVALYSGVRYVMQGMVLWPVIGLILVGSLIGAWGGAKVSRGIPDNRLRRSFALTVLFTALIIIIDGLIKIL